jgi:hypothetical protein
MNGVRTVDAVWRISQLDHGVRVEKILTADIERAKSKTI